MTKECCKKTRKVKCSGMSGNDDDQPCDTIGCKRCMYKCSGCDQMFCVSCVCEAPDETFLCVRCESDEWES